MTGKELKQLIAQIPDDAQVVIDGRTHDGYAAVCKDARIRLIEATVWFVTGDASMYDDEEGGD